MKRIIIIISIIFGLSLTSCFERNSTYTVPKITSELRGLTNTQLEEAIEYNFSEGNKYANTYFDKANILYNRCIIYQNELNRRLLSEEQK